MDYVKVVEDTPTLSAAEMWAKERILPPDVRFNG